jgi:hypothetical protein
MVRCGAGIAGQDGRMPAIPGEQPLARLSTLTTTMKTAMSLAGAHDYVSWERI